jgi:uncharacterized repeat protein (TIGR01451 family)
MTQSAAPLPRRAGNRIGWRRITIVLVTLSMCSCRAATPGKNKLLPLPSGEVVVADQSPVTQAAAVADAAEATPATPIECVPQSDLPIPVCNVPSWSPPGIAGPWPHDEYLLDGGDRDVQANVNAEGQVQGMELDDTVAVYDTYDGRTCIEPSNRVCLYAPRFAAVRKVATVIQSEQLDQPIGARLPLKPGLHQDGQLATTAIQPLEPMGEIGRKQPSIERVGEGAVPAASRQPIAAMAMGFSPHEDFLLMRQGIFQDSEKARLMEAIDAAITWSHDKAVQVVLDGRQAVAMSNEEKAQVTYRVDVPNHPCLRVIKTASTKVAKPGDIVDFTIRFDNTGDQAIEHVALIDNLTTRLEYVDGSAQSSRKAEFCTEVNEGDSLVLRWDFTEPLPAGAGGLVRFHCRVR